MSAEQTTAHNEDRRAYAKDRIADVDQCLRAHDADRIHFSDEVRAQMLTVKNLAEMLLEAIPEIQPGAPQYPVPFGVRRSVLQDWVHGLTFMQQSVLIAAVRGPDGIRKDHPVKVLCRWLRRSFLISAFDRRPLHDPYEVGGGSFTGPCQNEEVRDLEHAVELYLRSIDELPHHYQLHMLHAAEILGYKHEIASTRSWWLRFYCRIVNDAHLMPETEAIMDKRLGDFEAHWRAAEEVTAR